MTRRAIACIVVATVVLAGCTVGPDYKGAPATTNASSFKRAPDGVVATAPGVAAWWVALNDPQLTALIEAGIDNSPDLRAAPPRSNSFITDVSVRPTAYPVPAS